MNKQKWAGWVLTVLSAVPFIPSALMKIMKNPQAVEGMAKMGFPDGALTTLAILEVGSLVLFLIPRTAILGAILLTGYLGGAICTHLRVSEPVYVPAILGVLVWLAIWLREPPLARDSSSAVIAFG